MKNTVLTFQQAKKEGKKTDHAHGIRLFDR